MSDKKYSKMLENAISFNQKIQNLEKRKRRFFYFLFVLHVASYAISIIKFVLFKTLEMHLSKHSLRTLSFFSVLLSTTFLLFSVYKLYLEFIYLFTHEKFRSQLNSDNDCGSHDKISLSVSHLITKNTASSSMSLLKSTILFTLCIVTEVSHFHHLGNKFYISLLAVHAFLNLINICKLFVILVDVIKFIYERSEYIEKHGKENIHSSLYGRLYKVKIVLIVSEVFYALSSLVVFLTFILLFLDSNKILNISKGNTKCFDIARLSFLSLVTLFSFILTFIIWPIVGKEVGKAWENDVQVMQDVANQLNDDDNLNIYTLNERVKTETILSDTRELIDKAINEHRDINYC